MADQCQVDIETQESSSSFPHSRVGGRSSNGKIKFPVVFKNIACTPAFISLLLTLCLVASTIKVFTDSGMLFDCLVFLVFVCFTCVLSRVVVNVIVFFIERYFVLKMDKTIYFVFALKTSVDYFICSSLILLSWYLIIKPDITIFVIRFVTVTLSTIVIATVIWIFKIVVLKVLDCPFHEMDFFQNMRDHWIFQEYVLQTLLMGCSRGSDNSEKSTPRAQLKWIKGACDNMLLLVLFIRRLHTICDALANSNFDDDHQVEKVMSMLFRNLTNNQVRDIQDTDLLRVMKEHDISNVLDLFEGTTGTKSISEASLRKWMVKVFNERRHVVHLLNSTSTVIEQLNRFVFLNIPFLIALVWCLLMGFGTTNFLLCISSNLLVFAIIFGEYCKMIFEGIMLVIAVHPFDKGDHCVIDSEQLVVEEIGLLNTVFLKENNENLNCLNSVLLTKSISNLNRSTDLRYTLEILVSSANSSETIAGLKLKIDKFLRSKPESWRAEHCFDLKGIDDVTQKYNLQITHATKFQNYKEMKYQRSELVLELKILLKKHKIKNFTIQ